jgi:hypothetical protein
MPSSVDAAFFNERFDADILAPWARRTARLDHIVHHLALALGGRPAASSFHRLMMPERSGNDTALSSAERIEIKPRRTAPDHRVLKLAFRWIAGPGKRRCARMLERERACPPFGRPRGLTFMI